MDVLYLLVPMSVLAMLAILAVFAWALHGGQFDEVDAIGAEILATSDAVLDVDQVQDAEPLEESRHPDIHRKRSSP